MNKIFDEIGCLNIEDIIVKQPSFIKIMEDGVVTDDEVAEQTQTVTDILHKIEDTCSDEEIELVRQLLAEVSVLVTINNYRG